MKKGDKKKAEKDIDRLLDKKTSSLEELEVSIPNYFTAF